MIGRQCWVEVLSGTAVCLVLAGSVVAATVNYHGMVDGAGQNVMVDYGTPAGGHNGIGYSFLGTKPWTNINGGSAGPTATETVLRLGTTGGTPFRSYPSFLNADNVDFTKLSGSADAITVSQGTSGGLNRGFYRFRYGVFNDPANPGDPRVQSLILANDNTVAGVANSDGSWDLIDLHINGVDPVPSEFLFGVVVDNGNGDNDAPNSLRLRQIAAVAGGSLGADAGLIAMTNHNGGVRPNPGYLTPPGDELPNETDVYWFRISGAVLGDTFTLSGTNNNNNIPISGGFVFAAVPEPSMLALFTGAAGLLGLQRRKRR
jgi:hypothetical protein